jgi:hypothetical protein
MIKTYYYAGKLSYICSTLSVGKEQKAAVALASAVIIPSQAEKEL